MKALVFLLVLVNLLFYAFTEGVFGRPGNPDAGRVDQQLVPERVRIVARGDQPPPKRGNGAAPMKNIFFNNEFLQMEKNVMSFYSNTS